jgi:proteasome accessory factor B
MDISRLHRVLKVITLLQTNRYWSPAELARDLEVSRRTIYRDLNMLELAGIPFYFDRQKGGYTIHQTYWLPPINLSVEEALSLVALAERCSTRESIPFLGKAVDAARKIESQLPLAIRAAVGHMTRSVVIRRGAVARHDELQGVYETARRAIADRRTLAGLYISFHEKKQLPVEIQPHWLVFHDRAWYVIGHSREHRAVRTFKLGRFVELQMLEERFAPPKKTLEDYLGNAWRFMPEGREYDVRLRFAPLVAPNVAEVRWHKTQQIAWQDDGSLLFDVRVDGLDEIFWWILGYGDQVEVLAPKPLRDRVKRTVENLANAYAR